MLSGAAAILFILAAGLRLESRFRPLDGQTAEAVGVVTEKRHGQLYEAYGTVRTANGEARRIKFTLWNAVADELEAGDSFRCTVRVTYNDPHTSEYRTSVGESRFLFCSTGEEIDRLDESVSPIRAVIARLRAETSQQMIRCLGTREGGLFSAITTGLRPGFEEPAQQMKEAGIYHVLAISGLHIAVFCHLVLGFTNLLPLCRRMRNGLALLCLWYPVLLSGGSHACLLYTSHQLTVGGIYGIHRLDVLLGDRQQMNWCHRIDVLEHQYPVIFIHLCGRDLPCRNLAEQTIQLSYSFPENCIYTVCITNGSCGNPASFLPGWESAQRPHRS